MRKAKKVFLKGRQLLMKNKPRQALEVYKEYLSYHSKNPIVWHNMGVAYALLKDKINAERCFKKALEIDPNYEVAKRNLNILKHATLKDLEIMAKEYLLKRVNEDKEVEIFFEGD